MKFKNDGLGWRDLEVKAADNETFYAHFNAETKRYFLACSDGIGAYASAHLTRRQLRAIANKILKELDR